MNSGPEIVDEYTLQGIKHEIEVSVRRHWGVRYNPNDPNAISGVYIPYSEDEARADAARCGGTVVSRTETTEIKTTRWEEA